MRNYSRHLLIACILALTLGLFAVPTAPTTMAQSTYQLYPTLVFEIPKSDYVGETQFQITLEEAMDITIHAELLGCTSRCLFELKPTGNNRRIFNPVKSSAGFPRGDSVYADYELEAGDYTLTLNAPRQITLFDNTSIQYFRIWYVPTGYKGPTRNVMSGVNPNLLSVLQGTTLALQLGIGNELNSTYLMDGDTWELSYVNFNRTLIGDRFSPLLSPDGKRLLMVEAANFGSTDYGYRSWLGLYDLLTTSQGTSANLNFYLSKQEEVQQNEEYAGASFSPDGKFVVFHTNRGLGRAFEIMLMDLTTKEQKLLTTEGGRNRYPSFSPDGKRIAFHSDRAGGYQIFSINVDGSDLQQLTDGTDANFRPAYSPDGKYIAFCSERDRVGKFSDGSYFSQTYVMQADGSKVRRLVDNSVDSCVQTWSPDGQWIAYLSQEGAEAVAYAVSLDGKQDYQLAKPISLAIPEIKEGRARNGMGVRAISWIAKSTASSSTDTQDNDADGKKDAGDKKDNTLGGTNDNSNKGNDSDSGSTSSSATEPVLIYEDTLDSAAQGAWGSINQPPNLAGVQNGAYTIDVVDVGDVRNQMIWWIFAPGFTDWSKAPQPTAPFTLLLDVNNGSCSGGLGECYVGAMWGIQSQFATHYTFFYSPFNQRWMVQYGISNTKSSITPNCVNRTSTLVKVFDGKPHQLRLDVKEESIELAIDKQSIAICEQPTDWHGTIGFAVGRGENDNSSRIQLSIDKITLYNGTLPK